VDELATEETFSSEGYRLDRAPAVCSAQIKMES
jgi:hypothetical protein